MDPALSPRDLLTAAEARVRHTKSELEAARVRARGIAGSTDWLADRSDLARLDQRIKDHPRLESELARAKAEFLQAYEKRLCERTKTCPFKAPPGLEEEIARLRWLHEKLKVSRTDADLESLLSDPRLDESDKEALTARIKSNRARWQPLYTLWSSSRKTVLDVGYSDRDWEAYIGSVSDRLQRLEQEFRDLMSGHDNMLRADVDKELSPLKEQVDNLEAALSEANAALSRQQEIDNYKTGRIEDSVTEQTRDQEMAYNAAVRVLEEAKREARRIHEEQKRAWWRTVATQPISSVVEQLRNVPNEHIETVLDRLLSLPVTDPHILNKEVHRFLDHEHELLVRRPGVAAPVVVAYISRLVGNGDYTRAHKLLSLFPVTDRSALAGVVAYLRYVISDPPKLSNDTYYSKLSSEDLFLAACYYYDPSAPSVRDSEPAAWPTLKKQSRWEDYASLEHVLSKAGGKALNDFKVKGLQPRIAELAFRDIYGQLHGATAQNKLCDLNLECVPSLDMPQTLDSRPKLPGADWRDGKGREYDVKSNLYWPSQKEKVGLRGFFIRRSKIPNHAFPGFVFTHKDDTSCKWIYVGDYHHIPKMEQLDRVLPFCFRLPSNARFVLPSEAVDLDLGMQLLSDDWLRIGWQLAAGVPQGLPQGQPTTPDGLLDEFIKRCLEECRGTFLEYALWKALTDTTLKACSQYDRALVRPFLERADLLVARRELPVRLPRIDDDPILSRWITEVLKPLSENWSKIQCPGCGIIADQPGTLELSISRMTSAGTIRGQIKCSQGHVTKDVTVLTHCHGRGCGHYPLIIGKNRLCSQCKGLFCDYRSTGKPCESCNKNPCECCRCAFKNSWNASDWEFPLDSE